MNTIYTPEEWSKLELETPTFLWKPYVPIRSRMVFIHGPGGVGKSAFIWALQNAIEVGDPFLSLPTQQAKTMLISTDMNIFSLKKRWDDTKFKPRFYVSVLDPFNIGDPRFKHSKTYHELKAHAKEQGLEAVFVDSLGRCHQGLDGKEETTVAAVYDGFADWFPDTTVVGVFHNRKAMRLDNGEELITNDDFRGSRKWVDDAVVQLQIRKVTGSKYHCRLHHEKSQVSEQSEPLDLYLDIQGKIELWKEERAAAVVKQWAELMKELPEGASTAVQIATYMQRYQASQAKAYRDRAMWKDSLKRRSE